MYQHVIRVEGPERIPAVTLRDLLNVLIEGAQRAVRLRLEGRSTAGGPAPGWLKAVSTFYVASPTKGSTVLEIEAPSLQEAAPDQFGQGHLFVDPSKTCIAYLEESLEDALAGNLNSDLYDDALITTLSHFREVFDQGIEAINVLNGRKVGIQESGIERILQLKRQTPASQRVRVAGHLDVIRYSDRMFHLTLKNGKSGVAEGPGAGQLQSLWGKDVVVSGQAIFRPSRTVLRIEADRIEEAHGDVSPWSVEPKPLDSAIDFSQLRRVQGARSGLRAIIGKWPGDESDEEFEEALREIS